MPAAPQLALHGLWPQNGEYCAAGGQDLRRVRWRDLPPVRLSVDLRRLLDTAMPGTRSHLDRYQWAKHGTCAGLDQEGYFGLVVGMHREAMKAGFVRFIQENARGVVRVADLCAALGRDLGPDFDRSVRIVQDKIRDGGFLLSEIRIGLMASADGRLDLSSRGLAPLDRGDGFRCGNARPEWRLRLKPD